MPYLSVNLAVAVNGALILKGRGNCLGKEPFFIIKEQLRAYLWQILCKLPKRLTK